MENTKRRRATRISAKSLEPLLKWPVFNGGWGLLLRALFFVECKTDKSDRHQTGCEYHQGNEHHCHRSLANFRRPQWVSFRVELKRPFHVPVQGPHDPNPRKHRWPARRRDQDQGFHCSLPFLG